MRLIEETILAFVKFLSAMAASSVGGFSPIFQQPKLCGTSGLMRQTAQRGVTVSAGMASTYLCQSPGNGQRAPARSAATNGTYLDPDDDALRALGPKLRAVSVETMGVSWTAKVKEAAAKLVANQAGLGMPDSNTLAMLAGAAVALLVTVTDTKTEGAFQNSL